jgi:hypothetical protein
MAEQSRVGQFLSQPNPLAGLRTDVAPFIDENLSEAAVMNLLSSMLKTAPATEPTLGGVAEQMALGLGRATDPRIAGAKTIPEANQMVEGQGPPSVGEMLNSPMFPLAGINLWHGSGRLFSPEPGAPFGRFRDDKMGTGVGMQRFGKGHYLSDAKGEARDYALAGRNTADVLYEGRPAWLPLENKEIDRSSVAGMALREIDKYKSFDFTLKKMEQEALITSMQKDKYLSEMYTEVAEWLKKNKEKFSVPQASLYSVELDDAVAERMRRLEEVLPKGQKNELSWLLRDEAQRGPPEARYGLGELLTRLREPDSTLGSFYPSLDNRYPRLGEVLLEYLGSPGVKYLSRSAARNGGQMNYVVRDPDLLTIVGRENP